MRDSTSGSARHRGRLHVQLEIQLRLICLHSYARYCGTCRQWPKARGNVRRRFADKTKIASPHKLCNTLLLAPIALKLCVWRCPTKASAPGRGLTAALYPLKSSSGIMTQFTDGIMRRLYARVCQQARSTPNGGCRPLLVSNIYL